jgi:hypothetical protein
MSDIRLNRAAGEIAASPQCFVAIQMFGQTLELQPGDGGGIVYQGVTPVQMQLALEDLVEKKKPIEPTQIRKPDGSVEENAHYLMLAFKGPCEPLDRIYAVNLSRLQLRAAVTYLNFTVEAILRNMIEDGLAGPKAPPRMDDGHSNGAKGGLSVVVGGREIQ